MREAEFQELIVELCRRLGLLCYHTHDSRRSEPGFPDLVIVGHHGVLYRELKTETGKVSPEQRKWILSLREAGCDAAVWRPRHWPQQITQSLSALGRLHHIAPPMSQAEVRRKLARRGAKNVPPDGTVTPKR